MKRFTSATIAVMSAFCLLSLFSSLQANADTISLDFKSVGGQSSGGYYVYPYNFSIDGSATLTPLMCTSFTAHINVGDSWSATIQSIAGSAEDEAAWLLNDALANPGNLNDDQWAVWELFDPGLTGPDQTGIQAMLSSAQSGITNWSPANFVLLVPVAGSKSQSTGDYSQIFLGYSSSGGAKFNDFPSSTPEPSSLILLGTGLLGLATVLARKNRSA